MTPDLSYLKVFGCLCYAKNKLIVDKFDKRAIPCAFIGYSLTQKGFKILEMDSGKIYVSRDVRFFEEIFPFASVIEKQRNKEKDMLGPQQPLILSYIKHTPSYIKSNDYQTSQIQSDIEHQESGSHTEDTHTTTTPDAEIAPSPMPLDDVTQTGQQNIPTDNPPKNKRTIKPPAWMKDYVTSTTQADIASTNCLYPIQNYIYYQACTSHYTTLLSALEEIFPIRPSNHRL